MPRTRIVLLIAIVATLSGTALIGWGAFGARSASGVLSGVTEPTPAGSASPSPSVDPAEVARREWVAKGEKLTAALDRYAQTAPEFSLTVRDNRTGLTYSYNGGERYETASVVKVDILAALLLGAQDAGRSLAPDELALARDMIRVSDNDATTALFSRVGTVAGLTAANRRLGLKRTVVDPSWGLTRTTTEDQARLLQVLFETDGPLNAASRKLALDLMGAVATEQRWGVSAAAKADEQVQVKNGWLSRDTENGLWIINSVGRITGVEADLSVAVLSHGHETFEGGIDRVEQVAQLARRYLKL